LTDDLRCEVVTPGLTEVGEVCTAPVEPDALLLPLRLGAVDPLGAVKVAVPAEVATVAVGSTLTEPT
jgi:hypothetical protein